MASLMRTFFHSKRRKTESTSSEVAAAATSSSSTMSSSSSAHTLNANAFNRHRRQHSSPGHLQQFQQHSQQQQQQPSSSSTSSTSSSIRIVRRRDDSAETLGAGPPKFKHRSPFYQSSDTLYPHDMRMILIEAESRVLYDTCTVIPVTRGVHPATRNISSCGEFQFLRRRKDTQKLSAMIFGGVPILNAASESFRIHVLEDEQRILVSKTFSIPKASKKNHKSESSDSDSQTMMTVKSVDGWRTARRSVMTTPEAFHRVRHISITFGEDDADSHFGSPGSSLSLPRAFSPPHRISKARRRQLAVTTSLSESGAVPIPSGLKARSRMSSISSSQNDDEHQQQSSSSAAQQHTGAMRSVALGILVPIQQRCFLMQHIPLIEAEMARFETRITLAASHPPTFLHNISKSWDELTDTICQLHNAPRLKHPYWLALNEKCHLDEKTLATEFCEQLAYLVRRYDRKEAGYFLSNLVTALLMHHMSWVASVASPPLVNVDKQHQKALLFGGMASKEGAPTVGYNALMAQYLEIAGSCGAMRSAKLCILGDDVDILASVCSVLSFFVRCSAVQHVDSDNMWEVPAEHPFSPPRSTNEETTSGAMMRRLRNNNQGGGGGHTMVVTPTEETFIQTTEITVISTHSHQRVTLIDRVDFPCCPTISETQQMWTPRPNNAEGLGRSMFAGPLDAYCPHFVLSALLKQHADMSDVYSRMFDEVRCTDSPSHRSQSSVECAAGGVQPENVLIVADIDELTVKVLSSDGSDEVTSPSESVVAMLEQFVGIHEAVPATAEFLVGIIEDSLAHIVGKSLTLVELVRSDQSRNPCSLQLTPDRVRTIIGCDHSDLRLIVNVAAVYWPPVLQSVLG